MSRTFSIDVPWIPFVSNGIGTLPPCGDGVLGWD